jgi:hypothetical protein
MPSKFQDRVAEGAAPYLEQGETVFATMSAALKGRTQQVAGSGLIGGAQTKKSREAAGEAGITLPKSQTIGVVITNQRLMLFGLKVGAKVEELATAVPLIDVESITVKRFGLGGTTTVTVRGQEIRFEGRVGAGQELVDGLERARAV